MPNNETKEAIGALVCALLDTSIKDELLDKLKSPDQPDLIQDIVTEYEENVVPTVISSTVKTRDQLLK